jgi:hypothetical protein
VTTNNVTLSSRENLFIFVNNGCVGARCTNEANSFGFSGKFGGSLAADGVARIKYSGAYK